MTHAAVALSSSSFDVDGAAYFPAALSDGDLAELRGIAVTGAGRRLDRSAFQGALKVAGAIAADCLQRPSFPVRAVLFDKTQDDNWAVGWHQDRTVAVRARADCAGFGPWTLKQGLHHVAPPIAVLQGMATLRLHIDDCDADNAPLQVACGSHLIGSVAASDAASKASALPPLTCLAQAGDIWAYATPILHASARAVRPRRRRVLQLDFATTPLPQPLLWLGLEPQAAYA